MARPLSNMLYWRGSLVIVISLSYLAGLSFAQNSVSTILSVAPSITSSALPQIHTVAVGQAEHKMKPEVTFANVGDTVEFRFYPKNHSVVRAEYEYPCIPYEMTGTGKKGFYSGFFPVDKILPSPPMFSILINDTLPVYFYCSAPGSCLDWGMVGVINPQANNSIDRQRQLALDSSYMLQPGQPFPDEALTPSTLQTSLPTPTSTTGLPNSTSTVENQSQNKPNSKASGLSTGAIAGIAVGAVAILILGALLFFFWGRNKALKDEVDRTQSTIRRRGSSPAPIANTSQLIPPNGHSTIYSHYAQQHQQQQPLYPFPSATTTPKHPSASVSPVPLPPPTQNPHVSSPPQHHQHQHHQSIHTNPTMGFISPTSPNIHNNVHNNNNNHNNNHMRTNTLESSGPWSRTPSYGYLVDGAAPAYEENTLLAEGRGARHSVGLVEMDGEGLKGREGEEQGKVGRLLE